jgi:hypothetical protein
MAGNYPLHSAGHTKSLLEAIVNVTPRSLAPLIASGLLPDDGSYYYNRRRSNFQTARDGDFNSASPRLR